VDELVERWHRTKSREKIRTLKEAISVTECVSFLVLVFWLFYPLEFFKVDRSVLEAAGEVCWDNTKKFIEALEVLSSDVIKYLISWSLIEAICRCKRTGTILRRTLRGIEVQKNLICGKVCCFTWTL